jgi:hypothetical protein
MKFLADIEVEEGLKDSDGDLGSNGQVLSSTGSGTDWIDAAGTIGGSITDNQIAVGASTANNIEGATDFTYIDGRISLGDSNGVPSMYIGSNAGTNATTGGANVGVGRNSMELLETAYSNSAFGVNSLSDAVTTAVSQNTAIGQDALGNMTAGTDNVALGDSAGYFYGSASLALSTSYRSVYVGADTNPAANNETNQIVIGYEAVGGGSNTITLGNDDVDLLRIPGLNATSGQVLAYNTTAGGFEAATPSSGSIGGSIADNQIAVGASTANNIEGSSDFTYTGSVFTVEGRMILSDDLAFASPNLFIGDDSGLNAVAASAGNNIGIGYDSLKDLTTGDDNIAIGAVALSSGTTNSKNVAIGTSALSNLAAGSEIVIDGTFQNSSNWDTNSNSWTIGGSAGTYNGTAGGAPGGVLRPAIDLFAEVGAVYDVSWTISNWSTTNTEILRVGFGGINLDRSANGSYTGQITATSSTDPLSILTDLSNAGVKISNLSIIAASGSRRNTAVGYNSGQYFGAGSGALTSADDSVFIGSGSRALASNQMNQIVIGYEAIGGGNNTITLGDSNITTFRIPGLNATNNQVLTYNATAGGFKAAAAAGGGIGGATVATQVAFGAASSTTDITSSTEATFVESVGKTMLQVGSTGGKSQTLININQKNDNSSRARLELSKNTLTRGFLGIENDSTDVTLLSVANLNLDCGSTADIIMTSSSTAKVGIGNTSPDEKLDVTGRIKASAGVQVGAELDSAAGSGTVGMLRYRTYSDASFDYSAVDVCMQDGPGAGDYEWINIVTKRW